MVRIRPLMLATLGVLAAAVTVTGVASAGDARAPGPEYTIFNPPLAPFLVGGVPST